MKPGRELDALVAEKVMGCKWEQQPGMATFDASYIYKNLRTSETGSPTTWDCQMGYLDSGAWFHWVTNSEWLRLPAKFYSTDIAAAWEVVTRMQQLGFEDFILDASDEIDWHAHFSDYEAKSGFADATTPAHAICLAALKAVGSSSGS